MKKRFSPVAAAVLLATGLFTGGLRAATAPAAIPFENDAAFNVTLSNNSPNKVVIAGELITSISGPSGAYDQSTTADGALILSPLVGQNFTMFIQTDHGSSLSLNVRPQPGIRLKGDKGGVTINPGNTRAQQHIDYAWAVTGYGAQGASTDYVISLEGTEGGRQMLASKRAFYISASRAKEHVQIYTDGKADWTKAVAAPERDIKTAHDALAPETQRQQARAIWAMGQPVTKTAIGRAWVRHQGMGEATLTAKSSRRPDDSRSRHWRYRYTTTTGKARDWRWSPWFPARRAD